MNNETQDWRQILADKIKGLAELIDALGEPIFSFIAVTVPFIAPFVIAQITATALVAGAILTQLQANWLAGVLEGVGIVGLSGLVLAIEKSIRSKNEKWDTMIYLLGGVDVVYFLFLVSVNVLLDKVNGVNGIHIFIKALICLVPLMTGAIYGYYRIVNREKIAKNDAKKDAYELRQEQREDRLKGKMIKAGINPLGSIATLNQDVPQVRERHASDFKDYAFELLDANHKQGNAPLSPRELTTLVNKNKRVSLDHNKCKGTWTNFTKEWKQSRGL